MIMIEPCSMDHLNNLRFVRYQDMVLFEERSFLSRLGFSTKEEFFQQFKEKNEWPFLRKKFGFKRAGFLSKISDDNFRSPNVTLFYTENVDRPIDPWVIHSDNGIKYTFDVTRTMFCKGNIKEKLRLAKLDCREEIVVDLFAGIGYFSLVFAVHCQAKHVYCCEWNPAALEALRRNVQLNRIPEDRITICPGDNRLSCPRNVAHRVQMGLIPTSLDHLNVALQSLALDDKDKCFTLHVHENLSYYDALKSTESSDLKKEIIQKEQARWANEISIKIQTEMKKLRPNLRPGQVDVGEVNRIKRYAPHIDHMVADFYFSNT